MDSARQRAQPAFSLAPFAFEMPSSSWAENIFQFIKPRHINHSSAGAEGRASLLQDVRLNEHFSVKHWFKFCGVTTYPLFHSPLSTTWRIKSTRLQFIDHLIYPAELWAKAKAHLCVVWPRGVMVAPTFPWSDREMHLIAVWPCLADPQLQLPLTKKKNDIEAQGLLSFIMH